MSLDGDWYSENGSHMRITADPTGGIKGTYISAQGHATGPYPLVGRYDTAAHPDHGTPLGWTVAWRNARSDAGSVTSWNGQYQNGDTGPERIRATWLLTASATTAEVWEATAVGQDVFTHVPPAPRRHPGGAGR
ncbi:avidin/streptavidin family protein [Streptomyces sp. S.PB5]|uniref:avidin/streptavidin family protein n=1 Tax=Streptomyces sp. S.PB5 TaxID=3020844 RepID=UPI0025B238A9|nr:avidin/streptavidin family protein [Streptomyces sp. S.PB5]MDN3029192.1 avidin/streptavidin family protein [Streptomyces sp. S.PB5]